LGSFFSRIKETYENVSICSPFVWDKQLRYERGLLCDCFLLSSQQMPERRILWRSIYVFSWLCLFTIHCFNHGPEESQ